MPTEWRSVRITFVCSPDIDPAGASDLLIEINALVHARYPDQVANVCVELPESHDFFGRTNTS